MRFGLKLLSLGHFCLNVFSGTVRLKPGFSRASSLKRNPQKRQEDGYAATCLFSSARFGLNSLRRFGLNPLSLGPSHWQARSEDNGVAASLLRIKLLKPAFSRTLSLKQGKQVRLKTDVLERFGLKCVSFVQFGLNKSSGRLGLKGISPIQYVVNQGRGELCSLKIPCVLA